MIKNIKLRARFRQDVELYKIEKWWYLKQFGKDKDYEICFVWEHDEECIYNIQHVLEMQDLWEIQMLVNDNRENIKIEID